MLVKCPECELQVSDRAHTCPHCGYPLKPDLSPARTKKTKSHMRLPNGFGQISEIKGKYLRKPWRAMVTTGFTPEGKPICRILKPDGYFATYNEAYEALVEYHKNPYDLEDGIRLCELYDKWSKKYFLTLKSDSSIRTITSAWKYCADLYDMRVKDIRARHIKGCIDSTQSANMKSRIKSLFNLMLDYAVEYEIVERNYARTFNVSDDVTKEIEDNRKEHISFTDEEMDTLWNNEGIDIVDAILIQCYMGWRPQELVNIRLEDVDLENWTMIGGMKTEAGTDRTVPIVSVIQEKVKNFYNLSKLRGSDYLICFSENPTRGKSGISYTQYHRKFMKCMTDLGLNPEHRPHDPRKQFVSMCKKYNVDEYAIKKLVGHEISDITEKLYTTRDPEWLKSEIEKIKSDCDRKHI